MLFIGDIHITTKYKERIISELKAFIADHPEENNIIFLGDYVYHFSYDRTALLGLYYFFIELFEQGKSVYVLAGNHDRLSDSFVFEEAQKAFSIIQKYNMQHKGELHFITKPIQKTIEGKSIIFLPFTIKSLGEQETTTPELLKELEYLKTSKNKNEQTSWELNNCLASLLEQNPESLVIHHYYINKTKLPGQKAIFSYKDIAISEKFLDIPNISLISGHLHQSCSFKNYLCVGSVRSTSSLEYNQEKFLFSYSPIKDETTAYPIRINPYLQYEGKELLNKGKVETILQDQYKKSCNNLNNESRKINTKEDSTIPYQYISITTIVDKVEYEQIEQYADKELLQLIKNISLKKQIQSNTGELLEKLQLSSTDNQMFSDWKQLLKDYLQQKYKDDFSTYEAILQDLHIL